MSYLFSDRYEILACIYRTSATQVYLVESRGSSERYIAKVVCRQASEDIYHEANLLQDLDHPAIPKLIDCIQEEQRIIIVEEYFRGESLDQYLLYHEHISLETFINIARQICEIISYLHHQPNSILYLDLKPSHIIVCGNEVKLIDFGIAMIVPNSGKNIQNFGTKKYAAPEQVKGLPLGLYTDIYGVAKVLQYMQSYLKLSDYLKTLLPVTRGLRRDPSARQKDMDEMRRQIENLKPVNISRTKSNLLTSIAIVGSDNGVSCTHIAIAFVCYLNQAGFCAQYRNRTEQKILETISSKEAIATSEDEIICHELFQGSKGSMPKEEKSSGLIQVFDCGLNQNFTEADATIYVCGGRLWQKNHIPVWEMEKNGLVVGNFFTKEQGKVMARKLNHQMLLFPFQPDPFVPTRAVKKVFSNVVKLMNKELDSRRGHAKNKERYWRETDDLLGS